MTPAERTPLETFEQIYRRRADPWGYESRTYERAKYERTLAALGGRRFKRALELGSSIGLFTMELAPRCDAVVGIEPSPTAIARARRRLHGAPHVEFIQSAVPEGLPKNVNGHRQPNGQFDLVVCSEVLYYLSEPLLIETIAAIEQRLAPRATLLAVHYTGSGSQGSLRWRLLGSLARRPTPAAMLSGDRVHEVLRACTKLVPTLEERHPSYRLDRFEDPG